MPVASGVSRRVAACVELRMYKCCCTARYVDRTRCGLGHQGIGEVVLLGVWGVTLHMTFDLEHPLWPLSSIGCRTGPGWVGCDMVVRHSNASVAHWGESRRVPGSLP